MNNIYLVMVTFNSYTETIEAISRACSLNLFDRIIVVDNNSCDGSYEKLVVENNNRYILLRAPSNVGFDRGNNIAFRYIFENLSPNFIVIANTDVIFSKECILHCLNVLQKNSTLGLVAPSMTNMDGSQVMSARRFPSIPTMIFTNNIYLLRRRYVQKEINRYRMMFSNEKDFYNVDAVSGGVMCFNPKALYNSGFFDENIFMYYDEDALCKRIERAGYKVGFLPSEVIVHNHDFKKENKINRLKISMKSSQYFFKTYISNNIFLRAIHYIFSELHYFEMKLIVLFRKKKTLKINKK